MEKIFSTKQNEFIRKADHRWNIKSGAVRSGKSYIDTSFIIPMRIRERAGKPGLNVILGVTHMTIERNVLEPMREKYGTNLISTINNKNQATIFGERVYCMGAEKINQVAKIRGASFKYVYGDEVSDWNEEVFEIVKSRLDKPYSCFDGATNPKYPTHWFLKFLKSSADIYLQEYSIFDNPYLDPSFVSNLCKEYEGTVYYDRYIKGLWVRAEGAIYRKYADNPIAYSCQVVKQIDKKSDTKQFAHYSFESVTLAIDFGGNKSGHALVCQGTTFDYKDIVFIKSRRYFGDYDSNDIDKLVIDFILDIKNEYDIEVDYLYWDSAETVLGNGLKRSINKRFSNIIVRPALKTKINDRIQFFNKMIGLKRIWLGQDCDTLSTALSEAVWNPKTQSDERLDDGTTDIDSLDAAEYTVERDIRHFI